MYIRKSFVVILVIALVLGSFSFSFATEDLEITGFGAATFTDLSGHWATDAVYKWAGYGIIKGFEGKFRPDDSITRGEMAVILDNMMDYQVKDANKFTDLQEGKFYTEAILKANAAGIIKGDGKTVRPTDKITREEAAVMLSRAFAVKEAASGKAFIDAADVSAWAKGAVFGMEAKGYIRGYNGKFNPKANITRAAAVTMINNVVKAYYTNAGIHTENVAGTAVVKVTGVILKGITVSENLIIAEGVAQGDVTLDNITVKGETVIRGGGENSIHIIGTFNSKVTIEKVNGKIRIVVDGIVQNLEIAEGEEIILEGDFGVVTSNTPGMKIVVPADSSVDKIVANANIDISGTGAVREAIFNAGANGSSITTPNTKVIVGSGVTGVTGGGGTAIPAGSTATNNSTGTGASIGTSTGGGGGGSTVPTPSISIKSVTSAGVEVKAVSGVYTIKSSSAKDNTGIDVTITNTGDVKYTATISIRKSTGTKDELAFASASGIEKKYLDLLSLWDFVTFSDIAKMFDHLGTAHSGWYRDAFGHKVEGSTRSVFEDSIEAMFDRMKNGETYDVTVTLTPVGGSADTASFSIKKEI